MEQTAGGDLPDVGISLIHWDGVEGRERQAELLGYGFQASLLEGDPVRLLADLKADPPGALVIDLSRAPAQGRDLAVALRIHQATRRVLLVFAGGKPEKVARVRGVLPDAVFTTWDEIRTQLKVALSSPPSDPVVPSSGLAGYSGTPLPKKLGIKTDTGVLLVRAPEGFLDILTDLPSGVRFLRRFGPGADLILWFVRSGKDLKKDVGKWASRVGPGGIWILWPKKSSGMSSDLSQALVREAGLSNGLVDYKIAAVDETWSGLKFARRSENG